MNFFQNLSTHKIKPGDKRKVFVGISGGVDSAVSALILQQAGFDVTGVFIRTWQPDFVECTWRDDRRDAIRVCAHLNIPFLECNAENEYRDLVGMQMINDYKIGLTPNPDILCNREVKFGAFWNFAQKHGADFIATGHYAKIFTDSQKYYLQKPKDRHKDQTYFLWTLLSEDLEHTIFPLADLEKKDVRKIAAENNLPNFEKKDSQGVCFLGPIDIKEFISHYTKLVTGNVLDTKGNIIGTHEGAILYTLGQRHGFQITKNLTEEKPYYVVARDPEANTITVSHEYIDKKFAKEKYSLRNAYFVGSLEKNLTAMYRYNGEFVKIVDLKNNSADIEIVFEKPILISPGQSVVIYQDEILVGGGICI